MRSLALTALLAQAPALAEPSRICSEPGSETAFHCRIEGTLEEASVCDMPNGDFVFIYGRPEAPELKVRRSEDEVVYTPPLDGRTEGTAALQFRHMGRLHAVGYTVVQAADVPAQGFVKVYATGDKPGEDRPTEIRRCVPGSVVARIEESWEVFE